MPTRVFWLAALTLAVMAGLQLASLRHLSVTYDEPRHLRYGLNLLHDDASRFDDSKMPVSALNAAHPAARTIPGRGSHRGKRGSSSSTSASLSSAVSISAPER